MKKKSVLITIIFSCLCIFCASSCFWVVHHWPSLTVEQFFYHLRYPIENASKNIIFKYILFNVGVLFLTICVHLVGIYRIKKGYLKIKKYKIIVNIISLGLLGLNIVYTLNRINCYDFILGRYCKSNFIEENYVNPSDIEIVAPQKKRNLIYIFMESMEVTYAGKKNGGGFDEDYIPELEELALTYEDFSSDRKSLNGAEPLPGTTWTMGGIFAQYSGLPLKTSFEMNSQDLENGFFNNIITLGDILENQGYNQMLLLGSSAKFAGKDIFFKNHGVHMLEDYNSAIEQGYIDASYYRWWGYEDLKLFEIAKDKTEYLYSLKQPFCLTILTADTHAEDGYFCQQCLSRYDNQYANVIACSSRQVSEFVKWIQQEPFYKNTTIVLSGDHLTMDSDFCLNTDKEYSRKTFVSYINSCNQVEDVKKARIYSEMDLFPTTVASLGFKIEGNRLGLGTNLFSKEESLLEKYGYDYLNKELKKKSSFMLKLENN